MNTKQDLVLGRELMRDKLGDGGDPKIKVPRKDMDPHWRAQLFERVLSGSVLKVGD